MKMKKTRLFYFFFLIFSSSVFLFSCAGMFGEEFARIPIDKISGDGQLNVESKTLNLKAGEELSLWTDLDIEYSGSLELEYQIVVVIDKEDTLDLIRFDAFKNDASFNKRTVTINNKTTYSVMGRLGPFQVEKDGSYEFNVAIFSNQNANDFSFNKGDLVFRK
ncbi:MAG: hypothetical protein JXR53_08560 [Bacteroidales bacterium]|nr:hypothetical protein [Bacteroidales bacterium]